MRNLRFFVSLSSLALIFITLLYVSVAHEQSNYADSSLRHDSNRNTKFFSSLFSFHGPSALFTPTATISLTDDNSTSFAARPAAFGPLLPSHGLSGPIWIGSGFSDDVLRRGGLGSTVEGELGCNDIPGWDDRELPLVKRSTSDLSNDHSLYGKDTEESGAWQDALSYLHGKPRGPPAQATRSRSGLSRPTPLADARFMQESAEISGKIVLLSRGGCGFSDKVKWAQRRGASAVIVGDNIRGGALVRMYARSDTTNVTIPSVFTSHGTAHLLSTLMPPGVDVRKPFGISRKHGTSSGKDETVELTHVLSETRDIHQSSNQSPSKRVQWIKAVVDSLYFRRSRSRSRGTSRASKSTNKPEGLRDAHANTPSEIDRILSGGPKKYSTVLYNDSEDHGKEAVRFGEETDGTIQDWRGYIVPPDDIPPARGSSKHRRPKQDNRGPELHDGLWVTLTPSSMSPSPFFNTLFMLVVSPLVTLGVVYTMLLLRTRIQRRRWRAPKSVVDRLPVRIYRTVAERLSPTAEQPPDQTPLLSSVDTPSPSPSYPADIPARPRSRTNSASGSAPQYGTIEPSSASPAAPTVHEKESALAEWRRKFGGTQVECVICLEEYVDGVSRVLQLPCGHDFHAECITPWLTTRRRTCPICKGDVVRSLQGGRNGSRSTSSHPIRQEDEDQVQVQAAETENLDDDADLPVPMESADRDAYEPDVERAAAQSPVASVFNSGLARSLQRRFTEWRRGSEEHPDRDR